MTRHYILNEQKELVELDDVEAWAAWFESETQKLADHEPNLRRVAETTIDTREGEPTIWISTVFLALDHAMFELHGTASAPLTFETMTFVNGDEAAAYENEAWYRFEESEPFRRYSTWGQAQRGHDEIVANIQARLAELRAEGVSDVD